MTPSTRRRRREARDDPRGHRGLRRDLHVGLRAQPARARQALREGEDVAVERGDRPRLVDRRRPREDRPGARRRRHDALPGARRGRGLAGEALRRQGVAPGLGRDPELAAVAVHARRAGRAALHRAHRRDRAVDRREVLRGDAGDGRGPPRRGVRPLPRREARQPVRHQRQPEGHPRRHPPRPPLGHRVPRHADHGRGPRARGVRHDAHDHDRAAAEEAAPLRDERRGAPRRVRRALVAGVLHASSPTPRCASARSSRSTSRSGCSAASRTPRCGSGWVSTPTPSTAR